MKKCIILLVFLSHICFSQNNTLNKEYSHILEIVNNPQNRHKANFLQELFGFEQAILFGDSKNQFEEKIKGMKPNNKGIIKIKKNPYFYGVRYKYNDYKGQDYISTIELYFEYEKYKDIKEIIESKFGKQYNYVGGFYEIDYFYVPDLYFIFLVRTDNGDRYLEVRYIPFIPNETKYDDFTKNGISSFTSYLKQAKTSLYDSGSGISLDFIYTTSNGEPSPAIRVKYSGKNWFFIKGIKFLFPDDSLVEKELNPDRNIREGSSNCNELEISLIDEDLLTKLLKYGTKTRVRVTGDKGNEDFNIDPINIYKLNICKYYLDNNIKLK